MLGRNQSVGMMAAVLLLTFVGAHAQEGDSSIVRRQAIVHFLPGVISLPQGCDSATLQDVTITVPEVETALVAFSAEMITKAYPGADTEDSIVTSRTGKTVRVPDDREIYLIRFPVGTEIDSVVGALESLPGVPYVGCNGWVALFSEPNDTYFHPSNPDPSWADQWNLRYENNIGANWIGAWNITYPTPPRPWPAIQVKVAIFDQGVDLDHPDLYNQVTQYGLTTGPHGTWVAGILGAVANNYAGIAGVYWPSTPLQKIVSYGENLAYHGWAQITTDVTEAARQGGCQVSNSSWGLSRGADSGGNFYFRYNLDVSMAYHFAYDADMLSVAAMSDLPASSSNGDHWPSPFWCYPAACGNGSGVVMAVGATDGADWRVATDRGFIWNSTTGGFLDVVAPGTRSPGVDLATTDDNGGYCSFGGTSAAAPQVAGLAALLRAQSPTFPDAPTQLTNDDVRWIIKTSAKEVHYDPDHPEAWTQEYGSGRINMGKALRYLYDPYHVTHMSVHVANPRFTLPKADPDSLYFPVRNAFHNVRAWAIDWDAQLPSVMGPEDTVYAVWGRKETDGWALPETAKLEVSPRHSAPGGPYVFEDGYCANVSSDVNHPTLRTYAYEVMDPGHIIWYLPHDAIEQGVTFEYTVLWGPKPWAQLADVPTGNGRNVKDGGCLTFSQENSDDYVYALKGNNTSQFYRYGLTANTWQTMDTIPWGAGHKRVKKGACMAAADGQVYAAKGNNGLEWWRYDPNAQPPTYPWEQMAGIPLGNRAVKEGSGAATVVTGQETYVYFLKGSNSCEFYRYAATGNTANVWEIRTSAPAGNSGKNFKVGSAIAYDGAGTIYALKGKYNEFFTYNVASDRWSTKASLPFVGSSGRKKKADAGAALTCFDGKVYALKGGNTRDLWYYDPGTDHWTQVEDMPLAGGRAVKGGGALVSAGDRLCALKGNNTREFYAYYPGSEGLPPGTPQPPPPGQNEHRVTSGDGLEQPRWLGLSSQFVVYAKPVSGQGSAIFKAPASGGGEVQLTPSGTDASAPVPSPDGDSVALLVSDPNTGLSEVAVVPSGGGTPTVLTSGADADGVEWSPDGQFLLYSVRDSAGDDQLVLRPPTPAGAPQVITTGTWSHEQAVFRSTTQIVMVCPDDSNWDQIHVLNKVGTNWVESALTSSPTDHEAPAAASDGLVCYTITDDSGVDQIGRVNADSAGSEIILTSGDASFEAPTVTQDGRAINAIRRTENGGALCRINPFLGGYTAITDDQADRGHPRLLCSVPCFISTVYEREDGLYNSLNESYPPVPIAQIALNPGQTRPLLTSIPEVVLKVLAWNTVSWADSLRISEDFRSQSETLHSVGNWLRYDSLRVLALTYGAGFYRFSVRCRFSTPGVDTTTVLFDSCRYDGKGPYGSFVINRGASFCACRICTLSATVADSGQAGLYQMRFATKTLANVVADPFFDRNDQVWQGNHYTRDSIGVAALQLAQDTLVWFSQRTPVETLTAYFSPMSHIRLSADVVTQNLRSTGNMEFRWLMTKSDSKAPGPDTQFSSACCTAIPQGYNARAGDNSLRAWFDYSPPSPPPGYCFAGGKIWFSFPNPPAGSGFVYLGNIRLEPDSGSGYENAQWTTCDTFELFDLSSIPGKKTVYGQFKDRAGNETEARQCERPYSFIAPRQITLDNCPPSSNIGWPLPGQIINCLDTLPLDILGIAWDPPPVPGLSHFLSYKLTWKRSDWSDDSFFGTKPDSLSYLPAPPVPPESMGSSGPYRHLAHWNARAVYDSFGEAWYKLKLKTTDSAGNTASSSVTVKLQRNTKNLCGMTGGSSGGATSITTTIGDNLYVGTSTGKVVEYTSSLDSTASLSLPTDSLGPPIISGVTTDSTGAIFVSDIRARDLKCYDDSGVLEQTIGNRTQLAAPDDIAVAANGDVYTIDRSNCVVRIYDVSGNLKRSFGSRGSDTACFDQPAGIALNHPRGLPGDTTGTYNTPPMVFIADKGNHRVQTFDTTGHFVSIIGSDLLQLPTAIALDSSNDCFVADAGNDAIYAFSPSGGHYLTITSTDTLTPIAAALSNDNGFIYAIDSKHNTLAQYTVLYTDSTVYGGAQSSRTDPLLIPKEVMLTGYPNPTTGRITIRYGVPRMMGLSLKVYDISGKLAKTLVNNETMKPGFYNLQWNCTDQRNRRVASGVYFYRLTARSGKQQQPEVKTKKIVIAR